MNIALQNRPIHSGNDLAGILTYRAYDFWRIFCLVYQVPRVNSLRAESQIEIFTAFQAAAVFKDRLDQLFSSAGICGGFKNDHRSPCQIF